MYVKLVIEAESTKVQYRKAHLTWQIQSRYRYTLYLRKKRQEFLCVIFVRFHQLLDVTIQLLWADFMFDAEGILYMP